MTICVQKIDGVELPAEINSAYWEDILKIDNIDLCSSYSVAGDAIFAGGYGITNVMDYVTISSLGNAVDFGDLTFARWAMGATSNGYNDRGIFGGGNTGTDVNIIDYVAISSIGNAVDFGDLTAATRQVGATSNGTNNRGIFGGGYGATYTNVISYLNISVVGNSTDFGDLTAATASAEATSNGINNRGVFGGGQVATGNVNTITYITITSTGNATDFGDLTVIRHTPGAMSNGTDDRGIFGGGVNTGTTPINVIDYITISSTGDATDFGDLTVNACGPGSTSNGSDDRGVFGGGSDGGGSSTVNNICYITITSTGNATDFGDLTSTRGYVAATSNSLGESVVALVGAIGVFAGGTVSASVNTIEYITITSTGNATDFGDLFISVGSLASTSNGTSNKGVFVGGTTNINTISYISISIKGVSSYFGDLTLGRYAFGGASNGTNNRGIFAGGWNTGVGVTNIIDYITIISTGNATDFGDLTSGGYRTSATSNGTDDRAVFGGGRSSSGSNYNNIDYVTITSTGDSTDFGDLSATRTEIGATSNGTDDRAVFGGGSIVLIYINSNIIDYITITSTGNATDFGDLSVEKEYVAATSNGIADRAVFGGGRDAPALNLYNTIEYITITSTGNVTDFGDLSETKWASSSCSNCD